MIDWSKPVRRMGHNESLEHEPRGADRWVFIDGGRVIYSAKGNHIRYSFEPVMLPRLENFDPAAELMEQIEAWKREKEAELQAYDAQGVLEAVPGYGAFS